MFGNTNNQIVNTAAASLDTLATNFSDLQSDTMIYEVFNM